MVGSENTRRGVAVTVQGGVVTWRHTGEDQHKKVTTLIFTITALGTYSGLGQGNSDG